MYIGTGASPFAQRMKKSQGWIIAGGTIAAILMVTRSQAQSSVVRFGLLAGALICLFITAWQFSRPPLKKAGKDA